jgi:outer membrane lipoprotein carrier protein
MLSCGARALGLEEQMKRRIFASFWMLGVALPLVAGSSQAQPTKPPAAVASATTAALDAEQIVSNVEAFYNRIKTFRASFKQRYIVPAYGKTKDSAGSVIFEKPGKMSWDYASNGNRIVSNGHVVKIYDKGNKQMYVQLVSKSQYPALAFLTGQGSLKQSFSFTQLDSVKMKYPGGYVLLGVPLQPTAAYSRVFFYVDATTFQVRRVLIEDVQGNRNRFDFDKPLVNVKAPTNAFVFTPPPGTQVIQPAGAEASQPSDVQPPQP